MSSTGKSRTWSYRFRLEGQNRTMGLGSFPVIPLEQAQEAALEARRLQRAGIDPIEAREAAKRKDTHTTFGRVAQDLVNERQKSWSSPRAARAWMASLTQHAPGLIELDIDAVTVHDVIAALRPIWYTKRATATRLRARIEATIDRATVLELRTGDNPAALKLISHVLPTAAKKASVEHHAALPHEQAPAFMRALAAVQSPAAAALAVLIHTACRTGEILGARWSEIDRDRRLWTIPAGRMKAGAEHQIPLTDAVLEILERLPVGAPDDLVFMRGRDRLGVHSLRRLAQEIVPEISCHGFRSSFRDWCGDETDFQREVAEAALAHTVGSAVENSYRRRKALEKRRKLMTAWSNFLDGKPVVSEASSPSSVEAAE